MNVDDSSFRSSDCRVIPIRGWTDTTFSLIRFELNEVHRFIFMARRYVDRKLMTLTQLRSKVEEKKEAIREKYLQFLNKDIPVQRCAFIVAKLLMARCDSMILYRYLPKEARTESENRLRDM